MRPAQREQNCLSLLSAYRVQSLRGVFESLPVPLGAAESTICGALNDMVLTFKPVSYVLVEVLII